MIKSQEPDLKTAIRVMQSELAGNMLFYELNSDQQVFALLSLAASIARVDQKNFTKRSKNARLKWADMVVRSIVPDLGNLEGQI